MGTGSRGGSDGGDSSSGGGSGDSSSGNGSSSGGSGDGSSSGSPAGEGSGGGIGGDLQSDSGPNNGEPSIPGEGGGNPPVPDSKVGGIPNTKPNSPNSGDNTTPLGATNQSGNGYGNGETSYGKSSGKLNWDTIVSKKGETRIEHINRHVVPNNSRETHGVFDGNPVDMVNDDWQQRGMVEPISDGMGGSIYNILYKNAGHESGYVKLEQK
ncbi:MAG: hypothetical protein MJ172_11225 [Clostridia bacterium]|nr:hypothetical protein [Clostridia bacterium]